LAFPNGAADLLAFGAATDKPGGDIASARIYFGLATAGKWITPQRVFTSLDVEIDLDNDGKADMVIQAMGERTGYIDQFIF
jgi:hypothetical protein